MKKHIKLEIGRIALIILATLAISIGIANAAGKSKAPTMSDITNMEGKGKSVIGQTLDLSLSSISGKMNTYCGEHHKKLRSYAKRYTIDKYVEIDGKQATVYSSKKSNGKVKTGSINAKLAYIFDQKQGYGKVGNNTEGQRALWHYMNDWVDLLFDGDKTYKYDKNDDVSISGNSVATKAQKYASSIGDTTSKQAREELNITDKTASGKRNKIKLDDENYKIGPFIWKFSGDIKSITVKADGSKISDVKFLNAKGKEIEAKDISSEEKFYIKIKNAENVTKVNFDVKLSKKTEVIVAHVWFLRCVDEDYQNLIHVTTKSEPVNATGNGIFDYDVKDQPVKIGLIKIDDRGQQTRLENFKFTFSTKIKVYEWYASETAYRSVDNGHLGWENDHYVWIPNWVSVPYTKNHYHWVEHTVYLGKNGEWGYSEDEFSTDSDGWISANGTLTIKTETENDNGYGNDNTVYAQFASDTIVAKETGVGLYGYEDQI